MKQKLPKQLFRGMFNYAHSIHILYCYAPSEKAAFRNFCKRLADKHLVDIGYVIGMFRGTDKYSIEIEKGQGKTNGKTPLL